MIRCTLQVPGGPFIESPLDGWLEARSPDTIPIEIEGRLEDAVYDQAKRSFHGRLTGTARRGRRSRRFAARIEGRFKSEETGEFSGKIDTVPLSNVFGRRIEISNALRGRLIPERRVTISATANGKPVGGIDLNWKLGKK